MLVTLSHWHNICYLATYKFRVSPKELHQGLYKGKEGIKYIPAIALVCSATTAIVDPASRCSSVSPIQAITFKPWESA